MKKTFAVFMLFISAKINAQMLCGTTNENGTITLTAPGSNTFIRIDFASYGTPNGSCGSFTLGACNAANSKTIVEGIFLGQNSGSINATNTVFGDPCGGTPKRLYIQAIYSSALPLSLISFTARKVEGQVKLAWSSDNETNTLQFVIEKSTDGVLYEAIGSVPAMGSGRHSYNFTDITTSMVPIYYYRIKMMDADSKFKYTNILSIKNGEAQVKLSVFPNPSTDLVTIVSSIKQIAFITNNIGQPIKNVSLIDGSQTINMATWPSGIYFIKIASEVVKLVKK